MKKTIFAPLMWLSITIILVSAFVLGCVHIVLIDRYIISSKKHTMLQSAERISELTAALSENYSPQLESFYRLNMDLVAQNTQSHIIVTDTKGNVVNFSTPAKKYIVNKNINIDAFGAAMEGENVYKIGPFDSIFGQKIFTVAVPVMINKKVYGIVFFNSPVPELYRDRYALFSMLAISILVSSIVAFILSYIISKNIIKPIRALSRAAHDLAKGNYGRRVDISNIDELAELGRAFNTMAGSIENHEKVRTAFIGNVSHDLRTPMTTINGFIQGILDGTIPPEEHNKYLEIVRNETLRLSTLVNSFLDVSKYGGENKITLKKTSFDINGMIRDVILSLEARIREKNAEVIFEFENENTFVYADKNEIHRVIMNLLDNAAKFVDDNGKIIIKSIQKGEKILFSVTNSGKPISEEDQKHIWERFYKSDKSRTQPGDGFGLGLFIVKSILNQHSEEIELESSGNATTFSFTLPAVK